ncbi:MAG: hypothetical protein COU65_00245 [Candidatus Pacebacteria bacterium CG10_big_fil_rev_8_21_14_0_10_42_12]|nr:hypothetical protein [Candidatus Paceibacterota bacterium]PIR63005.1 MAG: hypothetical protein COU65_00245 [Candidatus Pacebacteria bacterium CG10_big_fil_rev_8_21_14_0_10_42_12]
MFTLTVLTPTLPDSDSAGLVDAYWDLMSELMSSGMSFEEATRVWADSDQNGRREVPLILKDGTVISFSGGHPYSSLISSVSGPTASISSEKPVVAEGSLLVPLTIESYSALPMTVTVTLRDSSGSILEHNVSAEVGVSPKTSLPMTLTFATDGLSLPSDIFTGTVEIKNVDNTSYAFSFDTRSEYGQIGKYSISPEDPVPTYNSYYPELVSGFEMNIPMDGLEEGRYFVGVVDSDDLAKWQEFTVPSQDEFFVLSSNVSAGFVEVYDEDGNLIYREYVTVNDENDTFVDADARGSLEFNKVYSGELSTPSSNPDDERDIYKLAGDVKSLSLSVGEISSGEAAIGVSVYNSNQEYMGWIDSVYVGQASLIRLPPDAAYIVLSTSFHNVSGKIIPYNFSVGGEVFTIMLPLLVK